MDSQDTRLIQQLGQANDFLSSCSMSPRSIVPSLDWEQCDDELSHPTPQPARRRTMSEQSSKQIASEVLSDMSSASLGTLGENGTPFVTLVNVASARLPAIVMLMSDLAAHTKNVTRDPRCSLLIAGESEGEDALAGPRLTLVGKAVRVERGADSAERDAFLKRHPASAMYADFGDFAFWRFECESAHLVAGFGRVRHFTPDQLAEL